MCQVRKKPQALEISASLQAGEKDEAATPKCGHNSVVCGAFLHITHKLRKV